MRGSLGLSAYRTLSGRRAPSDFAPAHDRPPGELVWIHAAEQGNNRAVNDLAHRLAGSRHGCHVLLTTDHDSFGGRGAPAVLVDAMPPDHPVTAQAFAAHWAPDVVVWAWGGLRPNLVLATAESGAHMMLVDAARDGFDGRRDRWLPEVPKRLLEQFHHVSARDRNAHLRLAQLGRPLDTIALSAPLHPFGRMLPAADSDIADVSQALGGRPVWLAASVASDEIDAVLRAHKSSLKASHRLLLILVTADSKDADACTECAHREGLRTVFWGDGEMPDDNCQVLLVDTDDDLGLWLRIAPVTFLGGSLHAGHQVCDPYSAAAHGTAIIYGPHVGVQADAFTRLMNAGAARIVNSSDTLGRSVGQMIAPDHAAQMAMAGWDVVTQGADSLDRIIDHIETHLDTRPQGAL
ncbi:glycosyltransferase N-terminal domain-containing protein [uncultured Tateyamaria sp.]|uniref:3-deoxy-D-manno-octulosonic acid transferase n=1 Tax=uncultured Tateyamaria sp. TaxID=455651 RepID=UPI002603C06B|nr:glycosyltransferase N-terminal domain-containing protein [uncultured Tateyamaria sp.]